MNIFIYKDKNNTSAGYIQVTEDELQAYKNNSEGKVFLINLGHSIMETDEANFRAFYKERRREKYLREEVAQFFLDKRNLILRKSTIPRNQTNFKCSKEFL